MEWEGESLALLRQGLYRFFGASFQYPEEGRLEILRKSSESLEDEHLAQFAFHNSWTRLREVLRAKISVTGLKREHSRLFSAGPGGALCPLHESSYFEELVQPSVFIIRLQREYGDMGLHLTPEYKDLPDHLTAELEAVATLCGKEAEAWVEGNPGEARAILENEGGFLRRHLSRWFPQLAEGVREHSGAGFYVAVAEAADAFINHDLDLTHLVKEALP